MKLLRARLFLLQGEYWDECPRCLGHKSLKERFDATPLLTYLVAFAFNLGVRRRMITAMVRCWLCEGRGRKLRRSGYLFYDE
jgi:hypothetical protein